MCINWELWAYRGILRYIWVDMDMGIHGHAGVCRGIHGDIGVCGVSIHNKTELHNN